jgi:GTP-binding protein Era
MPDIRCGIVAVCGRPNAGKSTLINRLVGEEVSIVTPKAQTTRNRIIGIRNDKDAQVIFADTPGLIRNAAGINEYLMKTARQAMVDADTILYIRDCSSSDVLENDEYLETVSECGLPAVLALNKTDLMRRKSDLLPFIDKYHSTGVFKEIFPISSLYGEGTEALYGALVQSLPVQERLFPAEYWTDLPEKFFASEIIRESVFYNLRDELPYSSAVVVETFDENDREKGLLRIYASIHVERMSQKGMVIGKGGAMLKKIGTRARAGLEKFFGARIYLELNVVVSKNWTKDPKELKKLGYFTRES